MSMLPTQINKVALLAGLAATMAILSTASNASASNRIKPDAIYSMAERIVGRHGFHADPRMLTAMAIVESGDINQPELGSNRYAVRYEAHLRDMSAGIMQVLGSTARWLAKDMGYNAKGIPTNDELLDAETSLYFGAAYVDYLSRYGGRSRSESWIVQSYNAGPTNSARRHYEKYKTAKANLQALGVFE